MPGKPAAQEQWFAEALTGVVLREAQVQTERFADSFYRAQVH